MLPRVFSLESVRTDGWLDRFGEDIANFEDLCEIVGERVFAFAAILSVRITSLAVHPDEAERTIVEFVLEDPAGPVVPQRLTLSDFRGKLVAALLTDEPKAAPPSGPEDLDGLRLFLGVRHLLLAPLYGYRLTRLALSESEAILGFEANGEDEECSLDAFRALIREHLHDELERAARARGDAIDLGDVAHAEAAAEEGNWQRIVDLLRGWPTPLAGFLRTTEGQSLTLDTRALVAKGLGLLGTACVRLDERSQGEDIFRLAVQYAGHSQAGADIFRRLGESMLDGSRAGEAIAPLRRAIALGGELALIYPLLARAFLERGKFVAALACLDEAKKVGAKESSLAPLEEAVRNALGASLDAYRESTGDGSS